MARRLPSPDLKIVGGSQLRFPNEKEPLGKNAEELLL
jgi:hypothetical protein